MKKIKTLFKRFHDGNRQVYNEVTKGSEWVINGEGKATRKWDGTCCMVKDGQLYKRFTLKKDKHPPEDFMPVTEVDPETGKQFGWCPVGYGTADQYHRKAFNFHLADGTYELVGPKINGNHEQFFDHKLVKHGEKIINDFPRTFNEIRIWFQQLWYIMQPIEGVVWHHPDGRMVKIKAKDFGVGQ